MSIIEEITDYQRKEQIAGREPRYIELTSEQHQRLREWMESTKTVFTAPDGMKRISEPLKYESGMILGMEYIVHAATNSLGNLRPNRGESGSRCGDGSPSIT